MRVVAVWAQSVAFLLLLVVPAGASNPQVTLALEEVTCRQAFDALGKATGIPFDLREPMLQPGMPVPAQYARLQQRRNFTWRGVRLATVLRQLGSEYGIRFARTSSSYSVYPELGPPALPVPPRFVVEKQGVRISPSFVSVGGFRSQDLEHGEAPEQNNNLSVRLKVQWAEGEPDSIVGFDNVVAQDDLGNVLLWKAPFISVRRPSFASGMPDEWSGTINLNDAHPRANKLAWLEADLMVYGVYKPISLDIPFNGKERTGTRKSGEIEVSVLSFEQRPPAANNPIGVGPTVKALMRVPQEDRSVGPAFGYSAAPVLVGASGMQYFPRGGRTSGITRGGFVEQETETSYPVIEEPVVKAVFYLVERAEPKKLFTFRLNNIAFPSESAFIPRTQPRTIRPGAGVVKPDLPFHQAGGGTLILRTEVAGMPVTDGTLTVGLARKEGAEWGPLRWQDLPVDKNGLTRLPDLAAGVYRLLRIYRANSTRRLDPDGKWINGEAQITLVMGQNTTAVPLQWTSRNSAPATGK